MKSSFDLAKERSIYHFDTDIMDPRWDAVQYLGRIVGDWSAELETIIANAKPATWETRGYKANEVPIPKPDLELEEYDLTRSGMDAKMTITHLNWDIPPILKKMSEFFGLKDCMERIHVQMPGEVWNLHIDKLQKWCPENPDSVIRIFVQLTDWQPGQFWEYGNYHHRGWKAGDVSTFDWQNLPHSTANAGYHPRVTLQLTGIRTEVTDKFLKTLKDAPYYIA